VSLLIQGGINIPLVFGADEERPKWLSSRLRSRITPPGGRRGRRAVGTGSSCLPCRWRGLCALRSRRAPTFAELRDSHIKSVLGIELHTSSLCLVLS
jgi:hypothetical protein